MKKRFFGCAMALTALASVVSAQEVLPHMRVPAGTPIINAAGRNGGVVVYQNDFPEADPDVTNCGPGASCDTCSDFDLFSIWSAAGATGNRRYLSDDIALGAGPRQLVRYDFMVCGVNTASTPVDITSELWTINANGNPISQPGAPIANTQRITPITVGTTLSCFIINVKTVPGVILPGSLHLVLTSSLQSTASTGTFVAILDAAEYGSSQDRMRQTITGFVGPPAPNTNANWAGAIFFGGGTCPPAAGPDCTTGCAPFANMWAHIYATGICGNGIVEAGEDCEPASTDCCDATCHFVAAGTECRASAGVCDAAESCTGQSATCPPDGFSTGNVCRQAAGPCDVAESCDGSGVNCPADGFAGAGTPCRASTGACDPAESCNGTSAACPPDVTITSCISGDGCCPAGCTNATDSDCPLVVPTVSEWGLALLTLVGIAMGAVVFSRKASAAKA